MSHQAGRETDQEIVMQLQRVLLRLTQKEMSAAGARVVHPTAVPRYSTDLQAAWQLVEFFEALGFKFAVMTMPKERAPLGKWTCSASNTTIEVKSAATTAPLAISRAMLAVLGQLGRD